MEIGPYELLVVGVVALAVVAMVTFYVLRRYRLRRLQELHGEAGGPEAARDRAFNRLALARREAEVLAAQGGDVEQAQQLIDLASRSLDGGSSDRAYQLAQSAHETLVKARREATPGRGHSPSGSGAAPVTSALPRSVPGGAVSGTPREGGPSSPMPKNRAESQFQLRLFEQEIAAAAKGGGDRARVGGAKELYVQAHAAFARAEYAEAFRLALRGRRQVGGHVESLGPPPPSPGGEGGGASQPTGDPLQAAERVAAQERCPVCGHPTVAGDVFCRGCGTAHSSPSCPRCGAPRTTTDAFCGRCGQRYS